MVSLELPRRVTSLHSNKCTNLVMRPRHLLNPSYQSKWGSLWNLFIPNQMAAFITDKNSNLHLLKSDFLPDYRDCKFYNLPWATAESLQLLFDNLSTPLTVETNQEFEIWFSEDLFKWGYGANGYEKTCVAVYGLYVCKMRKYIEEESATIVLHAFITSILDSCNSPLYGLPQHLLSTLQSV